MMNMLLNLFTRNTNIDTYNTRLPNEISAIEPKKPSGKKSEVVMDIGAQTSPVAKLPTKLVIGGYEERKPPDQTSPDTKDIFSFRKEDEARIMELLSKEILHQTYPRCSKTKSPSKLVVGGFQSPDQKEKSNSLLSNFTRNKKIQPDIQIEKKSPIADDDDDISRSPSVTSGERRLSLLRSSIECIISPLITSNTNKDLHIHIIHEEKESSNNQKRLSKSNKNNDSSQANISCHLAEKIRDSMKHNDKKENNNNETNNNETDSVEMAYDITTYIRCLFHDFRGPLNNISMGLDVLSNLMQPEATNKKDCDDMINNIQKTCDCMSTTLDGFLNLLKLTDIQDVNNFELTFAPFNLIGLIKKVQYLLMFNIISKKIKIENKIPTGIEEWVMGDMNHLQHVIYNLLLNAIKFSKHSSKITFELITQKIEGNKHRIIISITDENKPISQSIKDKMFLSYNTSNSNTGTGLGLYICKKIVDLHAGKIYHEFPNITGNKFVIDMQMNICNSMKNDCLSNNSSCKQLEVVDTYDPAYVESSPIIHHKTIVERSESQLNTARSLGKRADSITDRSVTDKLRIAVVDDSELSRKLLTRLLISHTYLSDKKYKLYESFDGLDAVSSLHNKIDYLSIIFMDNIMPNITGVLASKIIRGFGYDNLIFGITGNGLVEDIDEFINNGADYVFVKPFKKEKLDMVFKFVATYGFARQPGKKIAETADKKAIMWVEC